MPHFFVVVEPGSCADVRLARISSSEEMVDEQFVSGKLVTARTACSLLACCDQQTATSENNPLPFRFFQQVIVRNDGLAIAVAWKEVQHKKPAKMKRSIAALIGYQPKKPKVSGGMPVGSLVMPMAQQPA